MKGEYIALEHLVVGKSYSRDAIAASGCVTRPTGARDPHWSSGIVRFENAVLLLVSLEKTHYEYQDNFDGRFFWWQSQNQQTQLSPVIRALASGRLPAYLFVRRKIKIKSKTQPFIYCGALSSPVFEGEQPVTALFESLDFNVSATGALAEIYAWRPHQPLAPKEALRRSELSPRKTNGQAPLSDTKLRKAIELYAMARATAHYRDEGHIVEDTSNVNSFGSNPYDLLCTRGTEVRRVEVKGTQSAGDEVLVTSGEVASALESHIETDLFVVHSVQVSRRDADYVLTGGKVRLIRCWRPAQDDLIPTSYRCRLELETAEKALHDDRKART